jgi:Tfp pilus assembly protein FimV
MTTMTLGVPCRTDGRPRRRCPVPAGSRATRSRPIVETGRSAGSARAVPPPVPSAARADRRRPRDCRARRTVATPPARLTRRGRLALGMTCLSLTIVAAVNPLGWAVESLGGPAHPQIVTVQQGDTLWGIAERARPGGEPANVIAEIVDLNALASVQLQPGQQLRVPRR